MLLEQYRRKLSKEEINTLPIRRYEGEVRLVRSEEELQAALGVLRREEVVGFDTETKPTFRKGKLNSPALVQLAACDVVYLVQLMWVPLGSALAFLLGDPSVLKVGVSIHDDMRELQKQYAFEPAGVVDLGDVARAHKLETQGLRNLAANFFHCRISKGSQCSNWSLPVLSERQVAYAATDAWIGREVFLRMRELGLALEPNSPALGKSASGKSVSAKSASAQAGSEGTSGADKLGTSKTGARKRRPRRPRVAV